MFKPVQSDRAIQTMLSTGTTIVVAHAFDEDGVDAWGCVMKGVDGSTLEFCMSDEAFHTFIGGVIQMQKNPELGA